MKCSSCHIIIFLCVALYLNLAWVGNFEYFHMSYFPFACMCILIWNKLFQCANLSILFRPISLQEIALYIIYIFYVLIDMFSYFKTSFQEKCFWIDWLMIKSQYISLFYQGCSVIQVLFSIHYFFILLL